MWDHETIMMIVQGVGETLYMTVLSTVLGYLFGLPGFSPSPQFNLGGNFADEMLVMHNFSQEQQTDFLGFFHRNGLAPVDLKAVLTPVTQHWSSLKLHGELSKEHTLMHKK